MNIVTQKAKKRQRIIEYSLKHAKSTASRKYKEPLSNIKRWSKRYDGTWQSLKDKSRQPHSHPRQHTMFEEAIITEVWQEHGQKGIDYVYCILVQEKGSHSRKNIHFINYIEKNFLTKLDHMFDNCRKIPCLKRGRP